MLLQKFTSSVDQKNKKKGKGGPIRYESGQMDECLFRWTDKQMDLQWTTNFNLYYHQPTTTAAHYFWTSVAAVGFLAWLWIWHSCHNGNSHETKDITKRTNQKKETCHHPKEFPAFFPPLSPSLSLPFSAQNKGTKFHGLKSLKISRNSI